MKCQQCEKPATFHITDITGDELLAHHLCPDCAKRYLQPEQLTETAAPVISGVLKQEMKLEQTAEELKELDGKECPICGVSFYEFRQSGRLGCPHDYVFFADELEPLLINVHGQGHHVGKQPKRGASDTQAFTELIRMRREMKEAVEREDYETASRLRDQIRSVQGDAR